MARALAEYSAKAARAIVLDVTDFSVLAMVNLPSYDLNEIPRNDLSALNALSRNALVSDVYEPGSTFKIVTAAANIEEYLQGNPNAYATNKIFSSSRTRTVDGTTIRCWSDDANGKHSNQTLAEALNNSFANVIQAAIQVVGTTAMLIILNWQLTIITLVCDAAIVLYARYSARALSVSLPPSRHRLATWTDISKKWSRAKRSSRSLTVRQRMSPASPAATTSFAAPAPPP